MNTYHVLIMIWIHTPIYGGGVAVVQQEFSSYESCEKARLELQKAHDGTRVVLKAGGCFPKHK